MHNSIINAIKVIIRLHVNTEQMFDNCMKNSEKTESSTGINKGDYY